MKLRKLATVAMTAMMIATMITGCGGNASDEITADSTITNDGELILAIYSGDTLCDVVVDSKTINGVTVFECSKTISGTDNITAKAIFTNIDTLSAYCEAKEF